MSSSEKAIARAHLGQSADDLDLHLAPADQDFFGPADCFYAQGPMRPNWGALGDPADDPSLDRTPLVGFGPEIISYAAPAAGRYKAMVHFCQR